MIQWYPWKLFVRKWQLTVPLALSAVVVVITGVWLYIGLRSVTEPVFLHYSVELGVDAIGSRARAVWLVVVAALIVGINLVVSNGLLLTARAHSYIVALATVPLIIALAGCAFLVLRANGVSF